MKPFKLDKNGIPLLSRSDIEERAEDFVRFFDARCLKNPMSTRLDIICERLSKEYGVKFVFGADLGSSPEGYNYRGRFNIQSIAIYIDKSLQIGDHRFNFTLAHELGHFVFHRNINRSVISKEKENQISDTNRQLILDHIQSDNPRDWLEWQANKFASSILLPRFTIPIAVMTKQIDMGITRRIGTIYCDNQPKNNKDYNEILQYLVDIYSVSKTAIKIRLRELSILLGDDLADDLTGNNIASMHNILVGFFSKMADKYK